MDVDAAPLRHIQHLLGQNPTVGHHRADIRLQIPQLLHRFFLPEILRLEHGNSGSHGYLLHRRTDHLHAPALGAIRLGIDPDHLKTIGQNLFQTDGRNVRRTHKHYTHGFPPKLSK